MVLQEETDWTKMAPMGGLQVYIRLVLLTPKILMILRFFGTNFMEGVHPDISGVKVTAFQNKNIPAVRHGGGSVLVWGCFAVSGPGRLAMINETMNSALC